MGLGQIPRHLRCPIRGNLMLEAVVVMQTKGRLKQWETYDKKTAVSELGQSADLIPNEAIREACFEFLLDAATSKIPLYSMLPREIPRAMVDLLAKVISDTSIAEYHEHARLIASEISLTALLALCKIMLRSENCTPKIQELASDFSMYNITVLDAGKAELHLTVNGSTTISQVKQKLVLGMGHSAAPFRLMSESTGEELCDELSLDDCKVYADAILHVEPVDVETQASHSPVNSSEGGQPNAWKGLIFIRMLTAEAVEIAAESSMKVGQIKMRVQDQCAIPSDQQRLIFAGKLLEDSQTLAHYNIGEGETLHLVMRLRGGMHHYSSTGSEEGDATTFDVVISSGHLRATEPLPPSAFRVSVRRQATCGELYGATVREAVVGLVACPDPFELSLVDVLAGKRRRLWPRSGEPIPPPGCRVAIEWAAMG